MSHEFEINRTLANKLGTAWAPSGSATIINNVRMLITFHFLTHLLQFYLIKMKLMMKYRLLVILLVGLGIMKFFITNNAYFFSCV